jgi:hypothetical protein
MRTDIRFIAGHRCPLLVRQLELAVFINKTAECHHLFRAVDIVNGFEDDGQLLPGGLL